MNYTDYNTIQDQLATIFKSKGVNIRDDLHNIAILQDKLTSKLEELGTDWTKETPVISFPDSELKLFAESITSLLRK